MKVASLAHSFSFATCKIEYVKLHTESRTPLNAYRIAAFTYFSGIWGTKFSKKEILSKNRGLVGFRRGFRLRVTSLRVKLRRVERLRRDKTAWQAAASPMHFHR